MVPIERPATNFCPPASGCRNSIDFAPENGSEQDPADSRRKTPIRIVPQVAVYVIAFTVLSSIVGFATGAMLGYCPRAHAESGEESFLPTWKLLKNDERKQFIAGYMFGWQDAAKVTDIAIEYVKENPQQASDGLTRIRSLYDMAGLKPDTIVRELETYYSRSENKDATLSQAITAVRGNLGR